MYRLSVTTLEQFRRVCETEYASESELIGTIRGEPITPNLKMRIGSAFDEAVFGGAKCDDDDTMIEVDGFKFRPNDILRTRRSLGGGTSQVKYLMPLQTSKGTVVMVGVADHINGIVVADLKAKFGDVDPSDYDNSLQWRFYLWMFGARVFRYVLAEMSEPDGDGVVRMGEIHQTRFWQYDDLEDDCLGWLERFVEWAYLHGLLKYLEEKK